MIWEQVEGCVARYFLLIYALGGGWGHLTRALSLGRIAARRAKVKILSNSPYAAHLCDRNCEIQAIAPYTEFATTCQAVRQVLLSTSYDCLVVDTFPRGLGGELVDILPQLQHIPRILIHRDIKPEYVEKLELRSFVARNYNAVIVPGEGEDVPLADLPIVQYTAPWLIRNAEELPDIEMMRSRLRETSNSQPTTQRQTILVCASGQYEELSFFGTLTTRLAQAFPHELVRCLASSHPPGCSPELWVAHWPGIEYLQTADVVVGGAGYNTFYECKSLGIPLVAFAFGRLYDRQSRRASKSSYWVRDVEGAVAAVEAILSETRRQTQQPSFTNGAVQAICAIEQIVNKAKGKGE